MPASLPESLHDLLRTAQLWRGGDSSDTGPAQWTCTHLSGRLVELSGAGNAAPVTAAMGLVLESQERGEPAAWVCPPNRTYYPPDVAACGIDLSALVTVFISGGQQAAQVGDRLLRSGAFGLVVLDLGRDSFIPLALQGRLVTLAKRHSAVVVCVTEKGPEQASLGSMVSLRAEVVRTQVGFSRFECTINVLKDKTRGPNWTHSEVIHAPDGLC
ncbi:MAG: hypothetical protein V3V08_24430 [Nannocystaceae bacterium]